MDASPIRFREERAELVLTYYVTDEVPERGFFGNQPKKPVLGPELEIGVYFDDDTRGIPEALAGRDLQVQIVGSAAAIEALGTYLVALARAPTANPSPHDHFEGMSSANGGRMHLILERHERPVSHGGE